jgi:flagellum-specific peptidoglycan hydrolase FlgJ
MYTPQQFIAAIKDGAISTCKQFPGLFPSLQIGQACLESNFGNSGLSKDCFNLFGIKPGSSWKGKVKTYITTEYIKGSPVKVPAAFRQYDNFAQSLWDRNNLLNRVAAYREHGVFSAKTPEQQAQALRDAGYATDPAYPEKLIRMIDTYNLKQYDPA